MVGKLVLLLSVDNFFLRQVLIALIFIELFKGLFKLVLMVSIRCIQFFLLRKRIKLMKNE